MEIEPEPPDKNPLITLIAADSFLTQNNNNVNLKENINVILNTPSVSREKKGKDYLKIPPLKISSLTI